MIFIMPPFYLITVALIDNSEIKNHSSDIIKNLYRHEVKLFSYDLNRHTVFTDRYAPIEKYTMEMLKKNVYQIKKE